MDARNVALTSKEYYTRGSTALLDAVGKTINDLGIRLAGKTENERPSKMIFVITTDGLENASREFTSGQVKSMITHQREKYAWEFVFMGANIDVVQESGKLGISPDMSYSFNATKEGVGKMFSIAESLCCSIRESSLE